MERRSKIVHIEFAFIRNALYHKNYNEELDEYINEIEKSIPKNTNTEIFISKIIKLAKREIKKRNYLISSYLFGLIHNFDKDNNIFNENQFYEYDLLSFYEHMIENNRLDILKEVLSEVANYLTK